MEVAPALKTVAAFSVTVAIPEELVKAVAAGEMFARTVSVLNVTTALGTNAPAASFSVAFTVAGAPVETEVTVAPAALVSASVNVGARVVVVPVVVVVVVVVVEGEPAPLPHPARTASAAAVNNATENLEISRRKKFLAQENNLCAHASKPPHAYLYSGINATVQYFHYEHNDLSRTFHAQPAAVFTVANRKPRPQRVVGPVQTQSATQQ